MAVENVYARYYDLIGSLVHLANLDYQIERWKYLSTTDNDVPESQYDTVDKTLEIFLDNILWDWDDRENLVGYIFENIEEYEACASVMEAIMQVLDGKKGYFKDDFYLNHPDWHKVVSLAKKAIVVLHSK